MDANQPNLKIKQMRVEELTPYIGNAKKHPEWQVEQIKNSIVAFGFNDPIAVWEDIAGHLIIVEGHGRLMAAKELGMEKVPVIRLDHLDDEGRRAYTLAHNKLTMNTDFDSSILDAELDAIEGLDMTEFGFQELEPRTEALGDLAEVPFATVLDEENNYVVLKFTNKVDWLQAMSVLGIRREKAYSTRQDGKLSAGMTHVGTGRVLDGAEVLNRLVGV